MNSVMYPPGEQCPPPPVEVTVAQHGSSLNRPVCPTLLPQNTPPTRTSSVTPEDVSWNNCALYSPITPNTPSHVSCQSNDRRERRTVGGGGTGGIFLMQLIAHPANKKNQRRGSLGSQESCHLLWGPVPGPVRFGFLDHKNW